jgi:hypothetical protein
VPLEGTEWVVVLAGVLDDDPGARPFRHIFVAHGPAWHEITDDLPRFEERPPEHQRLRPPRPA